MDKRPLEDRIRAAYAESTPDVLARIIESCKTAEQLPPEKPQKRAIVTPPLTRILAAVACLALFLGGLLIGLNIPETTVIPTTETSIYLDVNPSVELSVDDEGRVIECLPGNDDASAVIGGLKLEGVDMNTAISAIIGSMYINGYLTADSNSILVSIDSMDDSKEDSLLSGVTSMINSVFEKSDMDCSIIAQKVSRTDEIVEKAREMGVSVGKMYLVEKMVGALDELLPEDVSALSGMSIKELDRLYSEKKESGDKDHFDDDIKEGSSSGYDKDGAISLLTAYFNSLGRTVEDYEIEFKVDFIGKPKLVYEVTVKFVGDDTEYEYEFDCLTGEINADEDGDSESEHVGEPSGSDHGANGEGGNHGAPKVENPAPSCEIALFDENGATGEYFDPSKNSGKITVLNFWGVWCNPCKNELPDFDRIATEYADEVTVIAVHSTDYREKAPAYIGEQYAESNMIFGYDIPSEEIMYRDHYYTVYGGYISYPTTVIIDEMGGIVETVHDVMDYEDLKEIIDGLLHGDENKN